MNVVVTLQMIKETYIQFRVTDEIKQDFQTAAELRGLTISSLLHSFVVRTIREERELSPQSFKSLRRANEKALVDGNHRIVRVKKDSIGQMTDETKAVPKKRKAK